MDETLVAAEKTKSDNGSAAQIAIDDAASSGKDDVQSEMAPSNLDPVNNVSYEGDGRVAEMSEHTEDLGKVTVFNVGKHATRLQLEKLLKENGIEFKRAKKPPHTSHAILSFETEEQRTAGIEKIRKLRGPRGREFMKAVLTDNNQKRKSSFGEDRRGRRGHKHQRQDGRAGEPKSVAQATAALYGVTSYEEQLSFKNQVLRDEVFLRLPTMIKRDWEKRLAEWRRRPKNQVPRGQERPRPPPEICCPSWCRQFKRQDGVVPFDVLPIVPSPLQEGYRNKCEFTLGRAHDGLPTAGFRQNRFEPGTPFRVESPKDCPQVHEDMKALCVQMDVFMRGSTFRPYEDTSRTGIWRFMLVRRSEADNETMAKVVVNLTGIAASDAWKNEEERLIKEFSKGARGENGTNLVSLWVQEYDGVSAPDETTPLRLVWGKDRIEEALLGLRFSISPNSFFQVNTSGAEALYRVVIENLELGDDVMLMDVCCGAGTIGICAAAAGGAKKVFGADLCRAAIEDAKKNAAANGIENCEFVCGKAEDVVFKQLQEARKLYYETRAKAAGEGTAYKDTTEHEERKEASSDGPKFAAVVDPPRSGVHSKCLRALRATEAIKRLVYVSCNPTKSLPADAAILCSAVSNSTFGMPFRPVKAIPVDMFPHTPHMELVLIFERIEYEQQPVADGSCAPTSIAASSGSNTRTASDVPEMKDSVGGIAKEKCPGK